MAQRANRPVMIVKRSTMEEEMEKHAVGTAVRALKQFTVEKNAARFIKEVSIQLVVECAAQWGRMRRSA